MKKSLLLSTALLVGVGAFAQTNKQMPAKVLYSKARPAYAADLNNEILAESQKTVTPKNSVQSQYLFSACRNGVGMINEDNNTLAYDKDLNMVMFFNRIPPAGATPTMPNANIGTWNASGLPATGVSGFMVARYSTDMGQTWSATCMANNGTDFSRHPSGVIANTPGNTDPSLAKIVGVGPALGGGTAFTHSWFASAPANTVGNITTNDQQTYDAAINSGTPAQHSSVYSNALMSNGMDVWATGRQDDGTNYTGVTVFRGTTTGGAYTWTQDTVTWGPFYNSQDGSLINSSTLPRVAFAPNGQIGYVLINGLLAADTVGKSHFYLKPNLWKTTNGGNSWSLVNANYDWLTNHPEILCNLSPTSNDADWDPATGNLSYPAFFDAAGCGVTVDNNGVLHYVTTISPAASSHMDSILYNYTHYGFGNLQNDDIDKPWIYDFTTDGNGTWNQHVVGKLWTRNIETADVAPDPGFWSYDGTTVQTYSNRIRCSRTADGTKVFYSWTDGDTNNIVSGAYHPNTNPNFEYKGYDVATGLFTATKELSSNDSQEGGYWFHYTSTTAINVGADYNLPMVYVSSKDGAAQLSSGVASWPGIDFNYVYDCNILSTEFTETIAANTNIISNQTACVGVVGIKEVTGTSIAGVSQNFPNPFTTSSTVKVNLNKSENITLNVVNNIGQVVATQTVKGNVGANELTIDSSNLNNGIYFYSVVAGNSKVTRKMIVVK